MKKSITRCLLLFISTLYAADDQQSQRHASPLVSPPATQSVARGESACAVVTAVSTPPLPAPRPQNMALLMTALQHQQKQQAQDAIQSPPPRPATPPLTPLDGESQAKTSAETARVLGELERVMANHRNRGPRYTAAATTSAVQ